MGFLISILIGLAMVELYAWLPKVSGWLLALAIRSLPDKERERCLEEWSAALEALPNTLAKLFHALSFVVAARTIKSDALREELHLRLFEVVSKHSGIAANFARLSASVDQLRASHAKFCSPLDTQRESTIEVLNDAWLLAKRRVEAAAAANNRLGTSLGNASRNFEKYLQSREGVLHFWRSRVILRSVLRDLRKAEAASELITAGDNYKNACNHYVEMVKEVSIGRGTSQ